MALKKDLVFEGLRNMLVADERLACSSSPNISGYHFGRDLGVRSTTMQFGEIGSWTGIYRWFELFHQEKSLNFVMFNVHKSEEFTKRSVIKKRRNDVKQDDTGQKVLIYSPSDLLVVGRGNQSEQHISLMLNFENNIIGRPNKKVHLYHDGDLTLWKHYRRTNEEVMEEVKASLPMLRNWMNDLVLLGKTTERKNYSINDKDIADMLLKLAIYAHLIDIIRSKADKVR